MARSPIEPAFLKLCVGTGQLNNLFVTFDNFQAALKLVLGQLAGYPLLLFYRFIPSSIKHPCEVCTCDVNLIFKSFQATHCSQGD